MSHSTDRSGYLRTLLRRAWQSGIAQGALLVGGVAFLAVALVASLNLVWEAEPTRTAAATLVVRPELSAERPAERWAEPGTPEAPSEVDTAAGAALARFGANILVGAADWLSLALEGLPAPTPTSILVAPPTSTPAPPVEVAEPSAPPAEVAAPTEEPAAPPAALPEATSTSPPPPPPPPTPTPPPACPTATMSAFAQALFDAINVERVQEGMASLALDDCVVFVARLRSEDMAAQNYFAHTSPDGVSAFSLLDQYGVPHGWAGENLARNNYPDDESVGVAIRALMESEGHRANILSTNYTRMGVGALDDGAGMKYFTMIFTGPP